MPTMPAPAPDIPPELREALKNGVDLPGLGPSRHGGADPKKRGIIQLPTQSVSVLEHNSYAEHLKKNILGYVTYLGSISSGPNGDVPEHVHQFNSANGDSRLLIRFISEPVYFAEDWNKFVEMSQQRNPLFLVSDKKLHQDILERRANLSSRTFSFVELVNVAVQLQIKNAEKLTREDLIEKILEVEFKDRD